MEFEKILEDSQLLTLFRHFLQKEFSQENLEFYLECQRYKNLPRNDMKRLQKDFDQIYRRFISLDGPKTVNLDSKIVKTIIENRHRPWPEIFSDAQKHVFDLMRNDSYPRFLQSTIYQNNLKQSLTSPEWIRNRKRKSNENSNVANLNYSTPKSIPKQSMMKLCGDDRSQSRANPMMIYDSPSSRQNFYYQNFPNTVQIDTKTAIGNRFIKIIFPDASFELISVIQQSTLKDALKHLFRKRRMEQQSFRIFSVKDNKVKT